MKKMKKKLSEKWNKKQILQAAYMLSFFVLCVSDTEWFFASQSARTEFTTAMNNFNQMLADVISSIGSCMALWSISEWGMSYRDNGMSNGIAIKGVFGSMVMVFAPQLVVLFLG